MHQEFVTGAANADIFMAIARKGEFSIVIGPLEKLGDPQVGQSDADIVGVFRSFAQSGATPTGRREAAREVARKLGLTANEVYRALERSKL